MANLYYVDEDGSIKTIANTDSPNFIGEPTTTSNDTHVERGILNVADAIKYIDSVVEEFNESKLLYANSSTLSGLIKGRKYMVSITGKFNPGNNNTYNLGPVAIRDSSNRVLKTSAGMINNLVNPKNPIHQSAVLILDKAPDDGKIFGLINYNIDTATGTNATYIMALRLS